MTERIHQLIKKYNMKAHPEGGYYAEIYRSEDIITTKNGPRNLMTSIYFLLTSHDVSKFHVIESDELWFHHEGADLSIHVLDNNGYKQLILGNKSVQAQAQHLVTRGKVFGSTVEGDDTYALVSCVVAPGFDFSDFRMLTKDELNQSFPNNSMIIDKLGC